ncbi:hypothetical protein TNCT_731511 [Trichonephila clavata]|uniref:Uncharacterized protein n=1 Tax=Trichonephila clavata TaxID=2740835 RepID=A0A8X6JSA9_TRICU|nr:hypothetical protein TNCT_731511 [Trichonephila clavata]
MRHLEEPILPLPLSTPFDSDNTEIEISTIFKMSTIFFFETKSQYPSTSTSASFIPRVTPQSTDDKISEYDCSHTSDSSNAGLDSNELKSTFKIARSLKETLTMFRKRAKKPTAPSAAARAAA